jgi:hypothetical protein
MHNNPTFNKKKCFLLFLTFIVSSIATTGQNKGVFLNNRFDKTGEIITKNTTRKELNMIKQKLENESLFFAYSELKYNRKREIIRITIKLLNKKSVISIKWDEKNNTLPSIKVGEENNIVYIQSISNIEGIILPSN